MYSLLNEMAELTAVAVAPPVDVPDFIPWIAGQDPSPAVRKEGYIFARSTDTAAPQGVGYYKFYSAGAKAVLAGREKAARFNKKKVAAFKFIFPVVGAGMIASVIADEALFGGDAESVGAIMPYAALGAFNVNIH